MDDQVIDALKELGFTATEAKIYLGLLRSHPATGYEVAGCTGVPRSAIYNVLGHLQSLGLVNAVQSKPTKYLPLPPDRLLELLRERHSMRLDALQTALDGLDLQPEQASTWTIRGYSALIEQARSLIKASERSVFASLWKREADQLAPAMKQAALKGRDIVLFSFTPLPDMPGRLYSYGLSEDQLEQFWPHRLILVVDHRQLLVGGAEQTNANQAVITEETALVEMSLSNLILDITLLGQRLGIETGPTIARLTTHLAPVDELLRSSLDSTRR